MPLVAAYHRPRELDEALALMAEPHRIVLAGGTLINADREPSRLEAVDIQACGLDTIEADGDRLRIGAMTTLDALARDERTPPALAAVARAELPSTLRTLATVGGTVAAADADSMVLAALLAHDAIVEIAPDEARLLDAVLRDGVGAGEIIIAVTLDRSGAASSATTGRTPADVPIVGAYARRGSAGPGVALTGVGPHPVLVDPSDPSAGLSPPDDFRGSAVYRRELAVILTRRAIEALD